MSDDLTPKAQSEIFCENDGSFVRTQSKKKKIPDYDILQRIIKVDDEEEDDDVDDDFKIVLLSSQKRQRNTNSTEIVSLNHKSNHNYNNKTSFYSSPSSQSYSTEIISNNVNVVSTKPFEFISKVKVNPSCSCHVDFTNNKSSGNENNSVLLIFDNNSTTKPNLTSKCVTRVATMKGLIIGELENQNQSSILCNLVYENEVVYTDSFIIENNCLTDNSFLIKIQISIPLSNYYTKLITDSLKEIKNEELKDTLNQQKRFKKETNITPNKYLNQLNEYVNSVASMALNNKMTFPKMTKTSKNDTILDDNWSNLVQSSKISAFDPNSIEPLIGGAILGENDLQLLPKALSPRGLITELLPFQLQGLGWMISKEHPFPPKTDNEQIQFWRRILNNNSEYCYVNTVNKNVVKLKEEIQFMRGGVLADDMGLGKTIQTIALILSDPTGSEFIKKPVKNYNLQELNISSQKDIIEFTKCTLLVCPVSVLGNWVGQIKKHVEINRIKYYVHHGSRRKYDISFIKSHNLVITTYAVMGQDIKRNPLHSIRWLRVVLDEGHIIRNRTSKISQASAELIAERRWILSGTPIHNKREDIYSLIRFLGLKPLNDIKIWKRFIESGVDDISSSKASIFQQLVGDICLRRTKYMILDGKPILELPPIKYLVHLVKFSNEERIVYKRLEDRSRQIVEQLIDDKNSKIITLQDYGKLLSWILWLRRFCDHKSLVRKPDLMKRLTYNQMLQQLSDNSNSDCYLCLNPMKNACIAICGHWFCTECLIKTLKLVRKCPICLAILVEDGSIIENQQALLIDDETIALENPKLEEEIEYTSSSKIDALMNFLESSKVHDSEVKSVVFSQWTSMLDLVEFPLRKRNIGFVRLDGKMQREQREKAIEKFTNDTADITSVFLVSLNSGSTGLNLVAASNCFLLDPWWNPQIERQAIDRIYRIGQTKSVTVIRFAVEDTIEQRVLELQESKKKMANEAFNDKSPNQSDFICRSNKLTDIHLLLSGSAF